ncbi:MAG: biopolymer transporter ExbD [Bacteroidota bacterium]
MFKSKKRDAAPEVNAGGMADIAFLLLIFFLVTTTILSDSGLLVKLPPWGSDPIVKDQAVKQRNLFRVALNANDQLLVRSEPTSIEYLRERAKTFIMNPDNRPDLAAKPNRAVISLVNDRSTSYDAYLSVYNELKGAYEELWEAAAQQQFRRSYERLTLSEQKRIRSAIPMVISEAEPVDLAAD